METAYTCFIAVYLIFWAWKILPLMNQSLKLPMLGCHDASSVTDAAFEWLFAHPIVKIFTFFCVIGFGVFGYWQGFSEVMTTNIPGHLITVGDHVFAGDAYGCDWRYHGTFWMYPALCLRDWTRISSHHVFGHPWFNAVCRLHPRLHARQIRNAFDRPWGSQWSVNRDNRGLKAIRYFCLSAFPCGSGALKTQFIAL
jgi:hypothetical protein